MLKQKFLVILLFFGIFYVLFSPVEVTISHTICLSKISDLTSRPEKMELFTSRGKKNPGQIFSREIFGQISRLKIWPRFFLPLEVKNSIFFRSTCQVWYLAETNCLRNCYLYRWKTDVRNSKSNEISGVIVACAHEKSNFISSYHNHTKLFLILPIWM